MEGLMTRALVPITDGTEEMEAVIVIDTLRRAKWEVVAAGMKKGVVTASRGVKIVPDAVWDEVDPAAFDLIVVPGGAKGVEHLLKEERLHEAIRRLHRAGKIVAAVCAGPLVLQHAGVLSGRKVTCHPDNAAKITQAQWVNEPVVIDGNIITSQGAGTCFKFALAIISKVDGPEKSQAVARGMVVT
jgi:4-methyl-5(b-hydroxyethyl)-thiazole monophosphate biosynthesis